MSRVIGWSAILTACMSYCSVAAEELDSPNGIYVRSDQHEMRIEFAERGIYLRNHGDVEELTHSQHLKLMICKASDGTEIQLRIVGENLVDQDGHTWVPRKSIAELPWSKVSPVTFSVLNKTTRDPVVRFRYSWTIRTSDVAYDPLLVRPVYRFSEYGRFQLLAPESCTITLHIRGDGFFVFDDFETSKTVNLTSKNRERKVEVLAEVGQTVKGVLVDQATGNPIAGARVSPVIFVAPMPSPDSRRSVITDAKGEFELSGVSSMGVHAWHSDYFETSWRRPWDQRKLPHKNPIRMEMEAGESLFGIVKDTAGNPIANADVTDGAGKSAETDSRGEFVLTSPKKWGWSKEDAYQIFVEKDEYLDRTVETVDLPKKGDRLEIILKSVPQMSGQVTSIDGKPIQVFVTSAGVGLEPRAWRCQTETFNHVEGRFTLPVRTDDDDEDKIWIGVTAVGFAMWESTINASDIEKPIQPRLVRGFDVNGSVGVPKSAPGDVHAHLLPTRNFPEEATSEISQRQQMGRQNVAVDRDGRFRFKHVANGRYILAISGTGVSPVSTTISVNDADLDAGPFQLKGTGSISGIVYEKLSRGRTPLSPGRVPAAFENGHVSFRDNSGNSNHEQFVHLKELSFTTDEHGRFKVENVPIGTAYVEIPFNLTSDIAGAHTRIANVVEGKQTSVNFFSPKTVQSQVCQFQIGDGTPLDFQSASTPLVGKADIFDNDKLFLRISLKPLDGANTSGPAEVVAVLDEKQRIAIPDVSQGEYQLVVSENRFNEVIYEGAVEVSTGSSTLTIPLATGCITGRIKSQEDDRYWIHVFAVGRDSGTVRRARAHSSGNFALGFLPADHYILFAHDDGIGWVQLPSTKVSANTQDVGSHALKGGGSLTGKIPARFSNDWQAHIEATDSNGVTFKTPSHWRTLGTEFRFNNLWPETWTVTLTQKDKVISQVKVKLTGNEAAECFLDAK